MAQERPRVLIVHSSRFGQSIKIADAIARELEARGATADLAPLTSVTSPNTARYAGFILVASVRYGHFDPQVFRLAQRYGWWLNSVPSLLVTVSLTARKEEKRDPAIHSYTRKLLAGLEWQPAHTEVVAGALEYPRYNPLDRLAITAIMKITDGPTDPTAVIEYTDWDQVKATADAFADTVPGLAK